MDTPTDTRAPHALPSLLEKLNAEQRAAVTAGDEPLLIVAGAGTGKTTTLAHRAAWLIASGVHPSRILLLTFTRRAAAEMLSRVDGILRRWAAATRETDGVGGEASAGKPNGTPFVCAADAPASARVWGGTFHATANRLLRMHGHAVGLDPSFTVMDRGDSEDLMGVLRTELGLARSERRFPSKSACLDIYSRCVNARRHMPDVVKESFPWCRGHEEELARLFDAYVERKAAQATLDYDDLLVYWHGLLAHPEEGTLVRARFDRVLVDEYQDTNVLQAEILCLLRPGGEGVTAVGDDAQAIYSFRAATVRNILDFPAAHPGTRLVTLERNYRSTRPIVQATNRVIALSAERHPKELVSARGEGETPAVVQCLDEDDQAAYVCENVLRHREEGVALKRQAVLFRATHHSLELEMELTRRDIPFHKYGGLRFAETAHVKDLLAVLRLAENPRDVLAGSRLLLLLPGVGPSRARALLDLLAALDFGFAEWGDAADVPRAAAETFGALVPLLGDLAGAHPGGVGEQVRRARELLGPLVETRYDDPRARLRDLEQLEHAAGRFDDRARFLAEMALDPPSWTEDLAGPPTVDDDWLVLSTMHSAKGLEWDVVFVLHAADGNIPVDMACGSAAEIEEERRLFYVACTRARDSLRVCHPLRYYTAPRNPSDKHGYSQLTRFLPETVRESFDTVTTRRIAEEPERPGERGAIDAAGGERVREAIRALWLDAAGARAAAPRPR